jgi:hypothetical protein
MSLDLCPTLSYIIDAQWGIFQRLFIQQTYRQELAKKDFGIIAT